MQGLQSAETKATAKATTPNEELIIYSAWHICIQICILSACVWLCSGCCCCICTQSYCYNELVAFVVVALTPLLCYDYSYCHCAHRDTSHVGCHMSAYHMSIVTIGGALCARCPGECVMCAQTFSE